MPALMCRSSCSLDANSISQTSERARVFPCSTLMSMPLITSVRVDRIAWGCLQQERTLDLRPLVRHCRAYRTPACSKQSLTTTDHPASSHSCLTSVRAFQWGTPIDDSKSSWFAVTTCTSRTSTTLMRMHLCVVLHSVYSSGCSVLAHSLSLVRQHSVESSLAVCPDSCSDRLLTLSRSMRRHRRRRPLRSRRRS